MENSIVILFWIANLFVLGLGAFVFHVINEGIAGNKQFSLQIGLIAFVVFVGGILAIWFSWLSTFIVLGIFAVFMVITGIYERITKRSSDKITRPSEYIENLLCRKRRYIDCQYCGEKSEITYDPPFKCPKCGKIIIKP